MTTSRPDGPSDRSAEPVDDVAELFDESAEVEQAEPPAMDRRLAVGAAVASVVVAVVLTVMVDPRLDRQAGTRVGMLSLTLLCVVVLAFKRRRSTRLIGIAGLIVWGLLAPTTLTTSATPPEAKFAIKVHDDAKAAMTRQARSAISVADIVAAVNQRGGGVGKLQNGKITGNADAFPLAIRPGKNDPRPRICLTIEHGTDAKIRRC